MVRSILSSLLTLGAVDPLKALTLRELSERTGIETVHIDSSIRILIYSGYVSSIDSENGIRFYLTPNGILAASSLYS
jgi:DNA-binding MarR family transcriptional regulator